MNHTLLVQRHRSVVTALAAATVLHAVAASAQTTSPSPGQTRLIQTTQPAAVEQYRRSLYEARPPLRGFRAPILAGAGKPWPFELPKDAPAWLREIESHIARRLALDGLMPTTAAAMERALQADPKMSDASLAESLRAAGLPVDLLAYFSVESATAQPPADRPAAVLRHLRARVEAGTRGDALRREAAAIPFRFEQSLPGFQVACETGEHPIGLFRMQLTRGTDWMAEGDGGSLDVLRQLASLTPDAGIFLSIEDRHLPDLNRALGALPPAQQQRITIHAENWPVAQWAQDNGKPGVYPDPANQATRLATLVPRYASRGEDGATFIPGETFVIEGFAAAGHTVVQSPLLFQGGDLLCVRNPADDQRTLLLGEAQVYRNVMLGLTPDQVLDAFLVEFHADRCVVLPAVSFHIDYELTVRAHGTRVLAFVNDTAAAIRHILACGTSALERAGRLQPDMARQVRSALQSGDDQTVLSFLGPAILSGAVGPGQFRESFAAIFNTGPADSGVGNLQRILQAMDILTARSLGSAVPVDNDHATACLRSWNRLEADRIQFRNRLQQLGWTIVPIPSLGDSKRSINYLNGIQDGNRYLMPAWGGLFAPLDEAAAATFRVAMPDVEILPIRCSESQRREGGLHCSISACPLIDKLESHSPQHDQNVKTTGPAP